MVAFQYPCQVSLASLELGDSVPLSLLLLHHTTGRQGGWRHGQREREDVGGPGDGRWVWGGEVGGKERLGVGPRAKVSLWLAPWAL